MVVLATESRKVSVEDAISLNRAVRFRENAGGQSGNNRQSYRDISMTARKNLPASSMCVWRSIECQRCEGKMKRVVGVSRENWIRRLSRTGMWQTTQPRQTSADQQQKSILLPHSSWSLGVMLPRGASRRASLNCVTKPRCCKLLVWTAQCARFGE